MVLGIDPGTVAAGYGAVSSGGGRNRLIACGAVRAKRSQKLAERLRIIHDGLAAVIAQVRPDVAVVEQPFAGENLATAIAIGEARGVALLACSAAGVPVEEYSPAEIKRAVVGSGAARKDQVALMVKAVLGLAEPPEPSDAADALAAAICYLHRAPALTRMQKGE
ncbi:MAG TPA: crossover junction endodeoxyribonuclease RuvC [Planctomycetota bacterium]|nr:crossover junction endodeoxyribonuclease RuvC [Planctomycetota bacterium]